MERILYETEIYTYVSFFLLHQTPPLYTSSCVDSRLMVGRGGVLNSTDGRYAALWILTIVITVLSVLVTINHDSIVKVSLFGVSRRGVWGMAADGNRL